MSKLFDELGSSENVSIADVATTWSRRLNDAFTSTDGHMMVFEHGDRKNVHTLSHVC